MVARKLCAAGFTAAAILGSICAKAATEVVPSFAVTSNSDDNVRLLPNDSVSSSASSLALDASLDVSSFNERGFLSLEPRAVINAYSNTANNDLNGDDMYLRTRAEYNWEKVTIGFRSDYRREAIIRAELPSVQDPNFEDDIGVENPDSVDSGRLVFINQDRKRLVLRPYVEFDISQRSRMRFQTDFTDVGYTGNSLYERTSYTARSVRAAVIRRPNERNSVTATLVARNYDADANGNQTDSVGITGEISRRVSDLWNLNLEAGVERSDYRFQNQLGFIIDNAAVEYSYGVAARHTGERTRLEFALDRRQNGSATGFVVDRNAFRVYVNHDFTQRLSMRIGGRAEKFTSLGDTNTGSDRTYRRGEFSLNWALKQKWSLVGGYNFTAQDFVNENSGTRSSSTIFFGIAYQGLSRPGAP